MKITVLAILAWIGSGNGDDYCRLDDAGCTQKPKPNIVLMLVDDLGYGDLACYGHPVQEPGPIDQLAQEGVRFTQFYSADSMCSPSRTGLLTGRLPIRSGVVGGRRVFVDFDTGGLPKDEWTVAEALKQNGYKTGFVGKWHLGINSNNRTDGAHLPSLHGFDFVGHNLPLTNMWECDETKEFMKDGPDRSACYVYYGDTIVQQPIRHATLTEKLLEDMRQFLGNTTGEQPFFFFFSFPQVHTSLETEAKFAGRSRRGNFGDSIAELQSAVGNVLKMLTEHQTLDRTLVLFMSDHGPHKELCTFGGSTGGLRGGKGNSFEGGVRVPLIAYGPGIVSGKGIVSDTLVSGLDLLPSLVSLAGGSLLENTIYDGLDASSALTNSDTDGKLREKLAKRTLFFYCNEKLAAVRHKNLKFHLRTSPEVQQSDFDKNCPDGGRPKRDWYTAQLCTDGDMKNHDPPLVYNLDLDPFETFALSREKVEHYYSKVKVLIEKHKKTIISVPNQLGNYSPKVIPCCNFPKCECNYP